LGYSNRLIYSLHGVREAVGDKVIKSEEDIVKYDEGIMKAENTLKDYL
jgi:hypothetical protein